MTNFQFKCCIELLILLVTELFGMILVRNFNYCIVDVSFLSNALYKQFNGSLMMKMFEYLIYK
jgi:hypothetical protein